MDDNAADALQRLCAAMQLSADGTPTQTLRVATDMEPHRLQTRNGLTEARVLPGFADELARAIQLVLISNSLAIAEQTRGAVLLHAALAVKDGCAVAFAGAGDSGKSTTVNRLPAPWQTLSDDACLVVPTADGFRAHPWPTWSQFMFDGPGGSWPVETSYPLAAIYFLEQASTDAVTRIGPGTASGSLPPLTNQVLDANLRHYYADQRQRLRLQAFDNICALTRKVPAYNMKLSLDGEFWRLLDIT